MGNFGIGVRRSCLRSPQARHNHLNQEAEMFGPIFKAVAEVGIATGQVVGMVVGAGCEVTKVGMCAAVKVGEAVVVPAAKTVVSVVVKK